MSRIVLEESVVQKLLQATGPAELCDTSGRVIGVFVPPSKHDMTGWVPVTPEPTEEELDHMEQQNAGGKRYTTAEVIAYLENL